MHGRVVAQGTVLDAGPEGVPGRCRRPVPQVGAAHHPGSPRDHGHIPLDGPGRVTGVGGGLLVLEGRGVLRSVHREQGREDGLAALGRSDAAHGEGPPCLGFLHFELERVGGTALAGEQATHRLDDLALGGGCTQRDRLGQQLAPEDPGIVHLDVGRGPHSRPELLHLEATEKAVEGDDRHQAPGTGRNSGTCHSPLSSNSTSTRIPISTSSISHPTMLVPIRTPASSSSSTKANT